MKLVVLGLTAIAIGTGSGVLGVATVSTPPCVGSSECPPSVAEVLSERVELHIREWEIALARAERQLMRNAGPSTRW